MNKLLNAVKVELESWKDKNFEEVNNVRIIENKVLCENDYNRFSFEIRDELCYWVCECEGKEFEFGGDGIKEVSFDVSDWLICMMNNVLDLSEEDFDDDF